MGAKIALKLNVSCVSRAHQRPDVSPPRSEEKNNRAGVAIYKMAASALAKADAREATLVKSREREKERENGSRSNSAPSKIGSNSDDTVASVERVRRGWRLLYYSRDRARGWGEILFL